MKKIIIILGVVTVLISLTLFIFLNKKEEIPKLTTEETAIDVNSLTVYGTHLNMSFNTLIENLDLILYNGEFVDFDIVNTGSDYKISNYVNDGIYLDNLPVGKYYLFLRKTYIEDEKEVNLYYRLNNTTAYNQSIYYSLSNNQKKITIDNDEVYPTMMIDVSEFNNYDNIYDVVLDPGHGGMDGGASWYGYKETDFTLNVAEKVKSILEENGIRVKLTREEGQYSLNEKMKEYGTHGRAVIPREVNSKYLFSFHFNSNKSSSVHGLEVYTAKGINYEFANLLVNNISTIGNLKISNNIINKVSDGIYTRTFTDKDIANAKKDREADGEIPYDITTNSNYYYIIRETGGIITGAYVDNRNLSVPENPYYNSNIGTETYLLELGYLSNKGDLNNVIKNIDKYAEAIANSILTLFV